jgi:C-terminal processing protease CtpA/Prc
MLIMPKAEYLTWQGRRFEGAGVKPDVEVPWSPESFADGLDNQLEAAITTVRRM